MFKNMQECNEFEKMLDEMPASEYNADYWHWESGRTAIAKYKMARGVSPISDKDKSVLDEFAKIIDEVKKEKKMGEEMKSAFEYLQVFDNSDICRAAYEGDGGAAGYLIHGGFKAKEAVALAIEALEANLADDGIVRAALGGDICAIDAIIVYAQKALKILKGE